MPSDRTRFTHDERQHYRAVVQQQGRAILDSDWNEGFQIASEEQRKAVLDIVGPAGTPDDGYEIGFPPAGGLAFDLSIRPGTMYVGGLRVELPPTPAEQPLLFSSQPDWLSPRMPENPVSELVLLSLFEHEISPVEDADLKDVALGGVDTAQRLRLRQRVERMPTTGVTCAEAMQEAEASWAEQGWEFDPATMQLKPVARLKVSFIDDGQPPDPCAPSAQGGYLAAENQLIRVQISGEGQFTWGFDNASFLYRITVDPDDATLVHLLSRPVDGEHEPRTGQVVEVLRPDFQLGNGERTAEISGQFMVVTRAFSPDGQSVQLSGPVAPDFTMPDGTTQTHPYLFLRVWEETVSFTPGATQSLGATGVQVILTAAGDRFALGAAWAFAVRPSTPAAIHPRRLQDAPQPPDAPRSWACPLAVIGWVGTEGRVQDDCREQFDNLVELTKRKGGGCGCCVTLGPEDVEGGTGLQAAIDKLVAEANGAPVTVSLRPGIYTLPATLRFGAAHSFLTLEGCDKRAILTASRNVGSDFVDGLVALASSDDVTLKRLEFRPQRTNLRDQGKELTGASSGLLHEIVETMGRDRTDFENYVNKLESAIAVRAADCKALHIEDCFFTMDPNADLSLFQAGIFLSGSCPDLVANHNYFGPIEVAEIGASTAEPQASFGILHTGTIVSFDGTVTGLKGDVLHPELDRATIAGNFFQGIGAALLVQTHTGHVRIEDNLVRHCYAGLLWLAVEAFRAILDQVQAPWMSWALQATEDQLLGLGLFLGRVYPLPSHFGAPTLQSGAVFPALTLQLPRQPGLPRTLMAITLSTFVGLERTAFVVISKRVVYAVVMVENDVEVLRKVVDLESGYAYLLWDEGEQDLLIRNLVESVPSSVALTTNRGVNATSENGVPAALVFFTGYCTITGGHLRNLDGKSGPCLAALPTIALRPQDSQDLIAVTGNVFHGRSPELPSRPNVPPPMDNWLLFNALVQL